MKKAIAAAGLFSLAFFVPSVAAGTPPRFFAGAFAETAHFLSYQGYGAGGEVGCQASSWLSFVFEGGWGTSSLSYDSSGKYSSSHQKVRFVFTPFLLSAHFTAPLGDRVQPYVGVGIASWNLKITSDYSYEYTYYSYSRSESSSTSRRYQSIAPIFKLGLAVSLTRRIWVVGEYRQIVAKDKSTSSSEYGTMENELYFGSADLKVGLRILI
jgi:opacity protein-like surface antigen